MIPPLVSVIIATYNRAHIIVETLKSIQSQSYENFECIIVDDGSTDHTESIVRDFVKKDARFQFHKRPDSVEKGHCPSRNYGFDLSKGAYVNWFDDDDFMHVDCLKKKIQRMQEKQYDFVSCEIATFTDDLTENSPIKNTYEGNIFSNYYVGEISFYSVCALWNKNFLIQNRCRFIEAYKPIEDWHFNINALFITKDFYLVKEVLVYYRLHENTISDNLSKHNVQLIYQEFETRKQMYDLFKSKEILDIKVAKFYLNRLRFLLRALLVMKDDRAGQIFKEYLKISIEGKRFIKQKLRTTLGYYTYALLGKGHMFLTGGNR